MARTATPLRDVGTLDSLLSRRILFVAGKGGTGKTSVSAALMLQAARRGKRVLGIEVDAKGDLAAALGAPPVGFAPAVLQSNISVLALHPEEALREYMKVFFKVPKMVALTPLSRIFDFIATSVPGPKDMLVIGKIAYEERRTRSGGEPMWDLIVADCPATGHALAQITAAREMRKITRGGMIRDQLAWVDATLTDPQKSALVITALPEEMPVVEALELADAARAAKHIAVGACVVNRMPPLALTSASRRILDSLTAEEFSAAFDKHAGGAVATMAHGIGIAEEMRHNAEVQIKQLRAGVGTDVVEVPLQTARAGLAMSRAVAAALAASSS